MTKKPPPHTHGRHGLLRFLATDLPEADLLAALRVIEAFKSFENTREYDMPFELWVRLEQLEDYLRLLLDPSHNTDDSRALAFLGSVRGSSRKRKEALAVVAGEAQ